MSNQKKSLLSTSVALAAVAALFLQLGPPADAASPPSIAWLNPSQFGPTVPVMSSEGHPFRLLAWTKGVAEGQYVRFEVEGPQGNVFAVSGSRSSRNYWYQWWVIPNDLSDGHYKAIARVYEDERVVASDELPVVVTSDNESLPEPADTVELTRPGGILSPLGFYGVLGRRPSVSVHGSMSQEAEQARVLYTTSGPGEEPEWIQCGRGEVDDEQNISAICTLSKEERISSVRAIAAVGSRPSVDGNDPAVDGSSDVNAIQAYRARPVLELSGSKFYSFSTSMKCMHPGVDVQSFYGDELPQLTPRANLDFHLKGRDGVIFATSPASSTFRPPNANHGVTRAVFKCVDESPEGNQALHPDGTLHLESKDGTDALGDFFFSVKTAWDEGTKVVAWLDHNDDDRRQASEDKDVLILGHDRTLSIRSSRVGVEAGGYVEISGSNDGGFYGCTDNRPVEVQARRSPSKPFRTITSWATDAFGNYLFRIQVNRTRQYRTLMRSDHPCPWARSRPITVEAF
jgi:hypothetical protein